MSKLVKKYPLLGSSANSDNLAVTFKGIAVALVPLIIMIARGFSVELQESEVLDIINAIAGVISSAMVLYGLGRKAYYKYFKIN